MTGTAVSWHITQKHTEPCGTPRGSVRSADVLPCTFMFCRILVCSAVYLYVLPCTCTFCRVLVRSAVYLYVLPCTCTFCRVLVCSAVYLYVLPCTCMFCRVLVCSAVYLYVLTSVSQIRFTPLMNHTFYSETTSEAC